MCFASYIADEDVYRRFVKHNYVLPFIHCHGICVYIVFFIVNSLVNAARSSLNGVCWRKFHGKGIKLKTFPQGYVTSLCGVVVRCSRVEPKVPSLSPVQYLIFFSFFLCFVFVFFSFFVLLFSINIYLNICHLIKCNKQHEMYRVSRKKIVHRILIIWINNLNFYHFLQFTVGKPELITTWSFSKQLSHEFFL